MSEWIWNTGPACSRCGVAVELVGTDWHHPGPADHEVRLVIFLGTSAMVIA